MDDVKLLEQLFYRDLQRGKRLEHKSKKGFNDFEKNNLKTLNIKINDKEQMTENRWVWIKAIFDDCRPENA